MKAVIAIIVVIILAAGAYALFNKPATTPTPVETAATTDTGTMSTSTSDTGTSVTVGGTVSVGQPVTVTYDGSSFTPATVTIKAGQSVTFVDTSSNPMWVASNPHPTHQGYDGTTEGTHCAAGYAGAAPFDECAFANSFTFTFTKVGSWGYHNHANTGAHGTVVVTQ